MNITTPFLRDEPTMAPGPTRWGNYSIIGQEIQPEYVQCPPQGEDPMNISSVQYTQPLYVFNGP